MSAARKLLAASWAERRELVRTGAQLVAVRAALTLLPLRTVLRLTRSVSKPGSSRPASAAALERTVWAVDVLGNRLFPRNPCLTQALLVQVLFRRAGRPAELRIGVRRGEERPGPEAHAWVECDGVVVIGSSTPGQGYVPLPPLGGDG